MLRVHFYGLLRLWLNRESTEVPWKEGDTVASLLEKVEESLSVPLSSKLLEGAGALQAGTIILVNRRNIHHLDGLNTPVQSGDVVALFPPGAGG